MLEYGIPTNINTANRIGREITAYLEKSPTLIISFAVIIIPVGGAAAGVANAKCAAINSKHIRPEAFNPTMPAKL